MQEGVDWKGPSGKDEPDIKEIIDGLRASPLWQLFVERIIEFRIDSLMIHVMKPTSNVEEAWGAERAKGAIIALRGLLELFDAELPRNERDKDVEDV